MGARMRTAIAGTAAVEWPSPCSTVNVAEQTRIIRLAMMVHVEVDAASIRIDRMERIPFDANVVNKLCPDIEIRHKIFRAMSHVDAVMPICAASFWPNRSAFARGQGDIVHGAKVG